MIASARAGAARDYALPALSGLLLAVAFPPARLLVPAFIGLVPLLITIAAQPWGPEGRWGATRAGLITGVVYFGLQLYWIAVALLRYSVLAIPAYLGMVLVLAGLVGGFAAAVHYTRERLTLPLPLLAAVFWTLLEWAQAHLGDLSFPWLGLGAALAPFPTLAGAADLVGTRGLTFWIAGINGMIASLVLAYRHNRRRAPGMLAALGFALVIPAVYGIVRSETLSVHPVARVGLVQPNIPEEVKRSPAGLDSSMAALRSLTLELAGDSLDLIVWPEVALPAELLADDRLRSFAHDLSRQVAAPLLVGAYGRGGGRAGGNQVGAGEVVVDEVLYNAAFLVDGSQPGDAVPGRYDKTRLVPFIERVPFIDPALLMGEGGEGRYGSLGRGRDRPLLELAEGGHFGVLICYESIFAPIARSYAAAGADYLVNITNDAWYGRDEWWGRTTGLWQHPAHMVMRAIETRSGVVRAANTGISMFIEPDGRTYGETDLFQPAVRVETVYGTGETTLFVRWGDWVGWLAVVFGVMALGVARFAGHADGGEYADGAHADGAPVASFDA